MHPHHETGAHAHVLEFGTEDVVGELQLGWRAVDVQFGEGDGCAEERAGMLVVGTIPTPVEGWTREASMCRRRARQEEGVVGSGQADDRRGDDQSVVVIA